jgi:hypothetical protein
VFISEGRRQRGRRTPQAGRSDDWGGARQDGDDLWFGRSRAERVHDRPLVRVRRGVERRQRAEAEQRALAVVEPCRLATARVRSEQRGSGLLVVDREAAEESFVDVVDARRDASLGSPARSDRSWRSNRSLRPTASPAWDEDRLRRQDAPTARNASASP